MISFALTEDQKLVQETVRKFAAEAIRPKLREYERARGIPDALRRKFHELGLSLVDVPEACGGTGMDLLTAVLVHEELAFGDPGAALALWGPGSLPAAVLELGTAEQAAGYLRRFGAGAEAAGIRGAIAWSEKGANLPEAGFATRARRDRGDAWLIEGAKAFVVGAGTADLCVVFAQVDPGAGWGGVSAFVVEASNPGVRKGERSTLLGLETAEVGGIEFVNCRVPESARLSGATDIVAACQRFFARVSVANAARQVGLARASYELALGYTQDRVAFGKPVAHFQAISFTLAEMAMELESARCMTWRAATALDRGAADGPVWAARAAVHANHTAWRIADDGVQLLGGAGYVQDHPAEKWLRDTKTLALIGPTDQFCQSLIAARDLGQKDDSLPASWIQPSFT